MELDKRLQITLDIIKLHIKQYGYSPSIREIVELTGYKSTSTIIAHLRRLEFYGYITTQEGKSRSIVITNKEFSKK